MRKSIALRRSICFLDTFLASTDPVKLSASVAGMYLFWLLRPTLVPPPIRALFPAERRDQNWLAFGKALGVELPPLEPQPPGVPRIPTSCADHLCLMFWMMEQHPDCVAWKAMAGQTTAPDNASEWDTASIQTTVFQAITEALGVDSDEVTLDTDMIEDLGME